MLRRVALEVADYTKRLSGLRVEGKQEEVVRSTEKRQDYITEIEK